MLSKRLGAYIMMFITFTNKDTSFSEHIY